MYASYVKRVDALLAKTKNTFLRKDSYLLEALLSLKLLMTVDLETANTRLKHIESILNKFTTEKSYIKFLKRHLAYFTNFEEKIIVEDLINGLQRPIAKETAEEFERIYRELLKIHEKAFKQIDMDISNSKTIEELVNVNNTIALVFEDYITTAKRLFYNLFQEKGKLDEKR